MSEILSSIVVEQTAINFSPTNNNINVTPEPIQLNIFTNGGPQSAGDIGNGQLVYSNAGIFGGVTTTTFANGVLSLGSTSNVSITGGTNGYILQTDGAGNLTWTNPTSNYANYSGQVVNAAQPNITSVGTLISLNVTGVSNLHSVSNVKITGGTNGYVLQTDGAGNLTWTAQTGGGGGNGVPGGANTQVQYNDAGNFGGTSGFTFDSVSGNLDVPGNLIVVNEIFGTVATANYANFAGNSVNANFAGNVTIAAQPNITSVGNLTSLTVVGTTKMQQVKEKFTPNSTGSTGTINYDLLDQAIILKTANASANFTLNFRGNTTTTLDSVMSANESITCTFVNKNGTTGYYANLIQVDGANVTPNWIYPGAPTTGTTSGKDSYTFNILKTAANTYTILASKLGFI